MQEALINLSSFFVLITGLWTLNFLRVKRMRLSAILFCLALACIAFIRIYTFYVFYQNRDAVLPMPWLLLELILTIMIAASIFLAGRYILSSAENEKYRADSDSKFRLLFENSSDEIYVIDFEENFLEVNQVICDVMGYTRDELRTMQVKDIKPDKYGDIVESLLEKLKRDGYLIFESEHVSKDGKIIPVEIKSRIIDYNESKAIMSIARDITERKQLERKIMNAVLETEENERERFAKDLHDGLGPLLSSIEIYINIIKSTKAGPEEKQNLLDYVKGLTSEAIMNVKEISNNLRPSVISRFGLVAAVNAVCNKLNNSGVIHVDVIAEHFSPSSPGTDLEVTLFRVVNELINNTLRHASARKITIVFLTDDSGLSLLYTDDGVGFHFEEKINNSDSKGMGLTNIVSRIKAIGGDIRFESGTDGGTRVQIHVNL